MNGYEYVECRDRKEGIQFTKEGNCFTQISDGARLAQITEDQSRETGRVDDARGMMGKLEDERVGLDAASAGEATAAAEAADVLHVAEEAMRESERVSDKALQLKTGAVVVAQVGKRKFGRVTVQ